jgi:hypothetical protein
MLNVSTIDMTTPPPRAHGPPLRGRKPVSHQIAQRPDSEAVRQQMDSVLPFGLPASSRSASRWSGGKGKVSDRIVQTGRGAATKLRRSTSTSKAFIGYPLGCAWPH